ncbi:MAG: malonyl-ACP O-methyltransferase BioC [Bacteroidales bacterium]
MFDKNFISIRFQKKMYDYDRESFVQKKIASQLIQISKNYISKKQLQILEIGCGTGNLTKLLVETFQPQNIVCNDISSGFQEHIHNIMNSLSFTNYSFIQGDGEELSITQTFDIITSASTFQWFANLPVFLKTISRFINPQGYLLFSTFGNKNLLEIKDLTSIGLIYYSKEELIDLLSEFFIVEHFSEELIQIPFSSPLSVLKHIRNTGVNAVKKVFWTKKTLLEFEEQYKKRFGDTKKMKALYNFLESFTL